MTARRCRVYDHCDGRPAVAELLTVYKDGGIGLEYYCPKCLALARSDAEATKHTRTFRVRGDGLGIVSYERITWLTTLVDGEVPA